MTTTEPTGPQLWQRLVQWQPAEAALLAQHIRDLPDDWPLRVFGVGRPDAALLLPPGATGEPYPDRAPEIAPYDEVAAPLDNCPACEEAEGVCRFHEGVAVAHEAQTQSQLEAVRVRPEISLREFLAWQADVAEAEDRGEEPPLLPAPVSSSPAALRDHDHPSHRAGLRDQLRRAFCEAEGFAWDSDMLEPDEYGDHADTVLAVLYREWPWLRAEAEDAATEPADRAAVLREAADAIDAETRQLKADGVLEPDKYRPCRDASAQLRRMADEAQQPECNCGGPATSTTLPSGTTYEEHKRTCAVMADEQPTTTKTEPESCAHCGKPIRLITGTLAAWWVHEPGGHTICDPQHAASSPRATPKPAAGVRQDEAQPSGPPVVAYRSDGGRLLNCLRHVPPPAARHSDFHPVTAEDLPDGGICTHPDCGVDVLIPQDGARP